MKHPLVMLSVGIVLFGLVLGGVVFFHLRGKEDSDGAFEVKTATTPDGFPYTQLLREGVHRGLYIHKPADPGSWGNPDKDFSRLATTYYHRHSPVGMVLQKINWFRDEPNRYASDARLPAALVGLGGVPANLPGPMLGALWSEPPVAVVGLNCGTPASYAHPMQPFHFYERSLDIIGLSDPSAGKPPQFHFVEDARRRGAWLEIVPGEEREQLAKKGPNGFYHVMIVETSRTHSDWPTLKWFSREAMELYFQKLAPGGIICFHTSSRNYDLPPLVASVAQSLGLASRKGNDAAQDDNRKSFTSEWVVVSRQAADLTALREPADYRVRLGIHGTPHQDFWTDIFPRQGLLLTDGEPGIIGRARR